MRSFGVGMNPTVTASADREPVPDVEKLQTAPALDVVNVFRQLNPLRFVVNYLASLTQPILALEHRCNVSVNSHANFFRCGACLDSACLAPFGVQFFKLLWECLEAD